jgi:hypothetical protein
VSPLPGARHPAAPARSADEGRLRSHVARLGPEDVVRVGGTAVTSITGTVIDLARSVPFAPALVVADAALASGRTTSEQLLAALDAGARGTWSPRRALRAADPRGESAGESRSRALTIDAGLPLPDLQMDVHAPDGRLAGRCDFGWRERGLLGEFDGRVKYGRLLRPGQQPGGAVFEEKRREDALHDEGWGVVRWVWADLATAAALVARWVRAFERGAR